MRVRPHVFACLLAFSLTSQAFAQERSAADLESARTALAEAQALRDAKNLRAALSKYKAAHAMAGTAITAYELGRCHMDLGDLVEARELLLSVARIPKNPNETARADAARGDAAALADKLEPRIPTVTVRITGAAPTDVTVTLDGNPIPPEAIGAKRKVDPGAHAIVAKSASGEVQSAQVTVAEYDAKDATLAFKNAVTPSVPESDDDKRFGIHIRFIKPPEPAIEPNEVWTLRDREGAVLCSLPCERWVRGSSGDYVDVSAKGGTVHDRVDVPVEHQFAPGTSIIVHPVTERGTPRFASISMAIMIYPYLGGLIFGITGLALCGGGSRTCDSIGGFGVSAAILGGSVALATAHVIWLSWTRSAMLNVDDSSAPAMTPNAPSPAARVSLVPGAVRLDTGTARTWFTPGGVVGSF